MLDALAKVFAVLFFWGGLLVLVMVCGFALVFSVWTPAFTVIAVLSAVSAFIGLAMLSVLK